MNETVIVGSHPAAIEYIAQEIAYRTHRRVGAIEEDRVVLPYVEDPCDPRDQVENYPDGLLPPCPADEIIQIIRGEVTPDDIRGKRVYSNMPLLASLACLAKCVIIIGFSGNTVPGEGS